MGKLIFFVVASSAICIIVGYSCQKKEISQPFIHNAANSLNGFEITGDNKSKLFLAMNADSNKAYYDTTFHNTTVLAYGDTGAFRPEIDFYFAGSSAYGVSKKISSPDTMILKVRNLTANTTDVYASVPAKTNILVNIYEKVNGRVGGAYSGQFVNTNNLTDTVIITNGRFSVTRQPDKP